MKYFLKALLGGDRRKVNKAKEARDQYDKVNESYEAFLNAAGDTLSLAKDITVGLRNRIDDYTSQIEATSLVIPDALILVTPEGTLENVNVAAETIFGYNRADLLTLTLKDLFTDFNGGVTVAKIEKVFGSANTFELIRTGQLNIRGIKKDHTHFYPNIKISNFTRSDGTTRHMLLVQDITETVLAEQRFIRVFDQQVATLKALPDILIMINKHMKIVQVINSSVYDTFIVDDHTGSHLKNILSAENYAIFDSYCSRIDAENPLEAWSFQVENDNGSITYYEARASHCGENVLIVMRDETDVVITREELLESEEHFRIFGQASNEAMMIHNGEKILDWNPRLSEMTGYTNLEIAGMRSEDFIHPMERSRIGTCEDQSSKAYTTLFSTKSGESIEVAVNERAVDWKNERARIKVIRDITHLKDVEQLLHLSRERYQSMTENTFDVVVCFGQDLTLTFANQTFMDYFAQEFKPGVTGLLELIDLRDHNRALVHLQTIDAANPVKRTLYRVSYNGETRWLDWIDRAIFADDGNILEYQGVGRDVTDYIKRSKEAKKSA